MYNNSVNDQTNSNKYLVYKNNQFYVHDGNQIKLVDENIEKNKIMIDEENLLKYQSKNIPEEFNNKYCVLFGKRIVFSSNNKIEALEKYKDFSKNNILVTFYSPNSN